MSIDHEYTPGRQQDRHRVDDKGSALVLSATVKQTPRLITTRSSPGKPQEQQRYHHNGKKGIFVTTRASLAHVRASLRLL